MAILYIVATPIGNLSDISFRAINVLKNVDLILCEDTRVTKKLLDRYKIKTLTLSYHQHSQIKKIDYILNFLKQGKSLALVSDAGTPGISDPGNKLIQAIAAEPFLANLKIVPVPGASAVTSAACISGFPMERFLFLGFPPVKKKRKKFFEEAVNSKYPVIFYESPYRIIKTLNELKDANHKLKIVAARELTKKFETIHRGEIIQVIKEIENPAEGKKIKGEFVIVIEGKK